MVRSTEFPDSIDTFPDAETLHSLTLLGAEHSDLHERLGAAVVAVETFVKNGLGSSKLAPHEASDTSTLNVEFPAISPGTPVQNELGFDLLISLSINVTASTGGHLLAGIANTTPPSPSRASADLAGAHVVTIAVVVPADSYLLVDSAGVITIDDPIVRMVSPL